jgi:hypothetical protein
VPLDIHRHEGTRAAKSLCNGNRKPAGTAAGVQHRHAWFKVQVLDNEGGTVGLGERIIELDQPR